MQNVIDMCNTVALMHDPEFSKEDCELAIKVMMYTHGKNFVTGFMAENSCCNIVFTKSLLFLANFMLNSPFDSHKNF